MELIITMPSHLGHQFYPNSLPVSIEHIKCEGESIRDIFLKEDKSEQDKQYLKDYVRYYAGAPWFDIDDTFLIFSQHMSYEQVLQACLNNNLDPF